MPENASPSNRSRPTLETRTKPALWIGGGSLLLATILVFTAISANNNALDFPGNARVLYPDVNPSGTSYTKEAWIYPHANNCANIISSHYQVFWLSTNNKLAAGNSGSYWQVEDPSVMGLNAWTHVAVSYDVGTNTMKLYKNGIQVASNIGGPANTGGSGAIGSHNTGGCYFDGVIEEVRMWNYALTQAEIQSRMNTELSGSESGLVAYYPMNQGTAGGDNSGISQLDDQSGNANHGTFNSFVLSGSSSNFISSTLSLGQATDPEIEVRGFGVSISDGDSSPEDTDATEMGNATVSATGQTHTFTIANTGTTNLTLTGPNPISIDNNTDFSLTQPTETILAPNSTTTFTVSFSPQSTGVKTTSISIANDDSDESPFDFSMRGTGIEADLVNGNMVYFDGAGDYIETPVNADDAVMSTTTWEAWVKPTNPGNSSWQMVMSIEDGGWDRFIATNSGYFYNGYGTGGFQGPAVSWNEWQHVAVVYDGTSLTFYKNGEAYPFGGSVNIAAQNASININMGRSLGGQYFTGYLDEVRIWNDARTQSEIRENMHLTLNGSEANLLAYYQLNESSGSSTSDNAGANDATLNGDVSFSGSEVTIAEGQSYLLTVNATGASDFSDAGVNINFTSAPGTEVIAYLLKDESNNTPIGSGTAYDSYWVIRAFDAPSSFSIDQLTFTLPAGNTIDDGDELNPNNVIVYQRGSTSITQGDWTQLGIASSVTKSSRTLVFSGLNLTSFSQFLPMGSGGGPFPVEWQSFDAVKMGEMVSLQWVTASEVNNASFELERSADLENWQTLQSQASQGDASSPQYYHYEDTSPLKGENHYRIKQIDQNGRYHYSVLRTIFFESPEGGIKAYPNPAKDVLHVELPDKVAPNTAIQLQLIDLSGRTVMNQSYSGSQKIKIAVNQLPAGMYFVQVKMMGKSYLQKFEKLN